MFTVDTPVRGVGFEEGVLTMTLFGVRGIAEIWAKGRGFSI